MDWHLLAHRTNAPAASCQLSTTGRSEGTTYPRTFICMKSFLRRIAQSGFWKHEVPKYLNLGIGRQV